jgi:hypothetical protein
MLVYQKVVRRKQRMGTILVHHIRSSRGGMKRDDPFIGGVI